MVQHIMAVYNVHVHIAWSKRVIVLGNERQSRKQRQSMHSVLGNESQLKHTRAVDDIAATCGETPLANYYTTYF